MLHRAVSHRPLPGETRNYVAIITGWTADEWASGSPPQTADTTIPQGVPCDRLANLILAPKEEAKRVATYIPRWGIWLAAHLVESKAWAIYRERLKRFAFLIGDREPMVLQRQLPGMGRAMRYIITIADDDRRPLDKLCQKLTAADIACDTSVRRRRRAERRASVPLPVIAIVVQPCWRPSSRASVVSVGGQKGLNRFSRCQRGRL